MKGRVRVFSLVFLDYQNGNCEYELETATANYLKIPKPDYGELPKDKDDVKRWNRDWSNFWHYGNRNNPNGSVSVNALFLMF